MNLPSLVVYRALVQEPLHWAALDLLSRESCYSKKTWHAVFRCISHVHRQSLLAPDVARFDRWEVSSWISLVRRHCRRVHILFRANCFLVVFPRNRHPLISPTGFQRRYWSHISFVGWLSALYAQREEETGERHEYHFRCAWICIRYLFSIARSFSMKVECREYVFLHSHSIASKRTLHESGVIGRYSCVNELPEILTNQKDRIETSGDTAVITLKGEEHSVEKRES